MKYLFSIPVFTLLLALNSCGPSAAEQQQTRTNAMLKEAYRMQDYNTVILALHQLYADDNNRPELLDSLFYCYALNKNYNSASILATQLIPAHANDVRFQLTAADSYKENKQFDKAAELYDLSLTKFKDSTELFYQFGICLLELKEFDKCIKAMEAVMANENAKTKTVMVKNEQVNYFAAAMNAVAICKIKQGKFSDAKKALQVVVTTAPFFQAAKLNYEKLLILEKTQ